MIDRKTRDQLAKAIRAYLNEELTAFRFDEALAEASAGTDDQTARTIARTLWFYYDDCKDHKIVAAKEVWDYFHRLLLLLESDAELELLKARRRWHPRQAFAALLLLAFVFVACRVGWGEHLLAYALPFGPPSMLLAWLNSRRRQQALRATQTVLAPFPSVGSLLAVRRRVSGFVKRRYPQAVGERRIRDPLTSHAIWVPWSIAWCVFAPLVLFFQMLPDRDRDVRLRLPGTAPANCPARPVSAPTR